MSLPLVIHFPLLNRDVPQASLTTHNLTGTSKIKDVVDKLAIIEEIPKHKIKLIVNGRDVVPLTIQNPNLRLNDSQVGWNAVSGKNVIYLRVDMNNHYLDGIGGLHYSDKKYIGRTKRLQERSLTVQKSIDDSNKRIQNYMYINFDINDLLLIKVNSVLTYQ